MNTIQRGQRSKELLDDPLIDEAFTTIEESILQMWAESKETSEREELWYTLAAAKRFKGIFTNAVSNGSFELAKLEKDNA